MKTLSIKLWALTVFSLLIFSCGSDDGNGEPPKTAEELAIESLAGSSGSQVWTVSNGGSVSKDGIAETAAFSDFELRFISNNTGKTYTTENGNLLFDSSGSWEFEGDNLDIIMLSGIQPAAEKEISFTRNQNNLRLEFVIPAPQSTLVPSNARVTALAGFYVFDLTLQE